MIFSFFEKLSKPFPKIDNKRPPTALFAFLIHYSKGMLIPVLVVAVLSAIIAILEVSLFGFLGQLVDWLTTQDRATFLSNNQNTLMWMGLLVLVGLPCIVIFTNVTHPSNVTGQLPYENSLASTQLFAGTKLVIFSK